MQEEDELGGEAEEEGEADFLLKKQKYFLLSREPDMGPDPRTLGSRTKLKADASQIEPARYPCLGGFVLLF